MADPDLTLDSDTMPIPPLDQGETGPQSLPLSPWAASGITSGVKSTTIPATGSDKAAIEHLQNPLTQANPPQAQVKKTPTPATIMGDSIRNKPKKTEPYDVSPARHFSKWGEPNDRPPPPLHQVPNIWSWFGRTNLGSSLQQIMGQQLGQHTDAYWRDFMNGATWAQNFHHKQAMNASQELETSFRDELMEARSILEGDPKEITPRLYELAKKYHDDSLRYKLHGKIEDAIKYLTQKEQWWQDLNKSNAEVQKQTQIDTNQAPAYEAPDSSNLVKPPKPDQGQPQDDLNDPFAGRPIIGAPVQAAPQPDQTPAEGVPPPAVPAAPAGAAPAADPPYVIPGEPDTGPPSGDQSAIPDTGTPGDIGAISAPDQGVQVAEAGMSDVAPSWAKEIPNLAMAQASGQQPPPYEWTAPPSDLMDPQNARTATGKVLRNSGYIRNFAVQSFDDPSVLDKLAKEQPDVANKAKQMASEIWGNLRSIAKDPRLTDRGAIIRAVNSQVPGLGDEAARIARGDQPPPGAAQIYGQRSPRAKILAPLVGKIDPSMLNPTAYQNRAMARRYWSTGKGGDMMLAHGAAYLHGFAARDALEGLRGMNRLQRSYSQYDPLIGGDYLRQHGLWPSVDEGKRMARAVEDIRVFTEEAEAVLHKGAPTVAGGKIQEEHYDLERMNVDALIEHVDTMMARLRDKMGENIDRFHAGTAQGPDQLEKLFDEYVGQGKAPRMLNGKSLPPSDALIKSVNELMNSVHSSSPRAQSPASGGPSIDDVMRRYQ